MKKLITENEIIRLSKQGIKEIVVDSNTILTPSALDRIRTSKMKIVQKSNTSTSQANTEYSNNVKTVAIGSDHTGYEMKQIIISYLKEKGYQVIDVGTNSKDSCDYPDFALDIAKKRLNGECERGIMLDATGIPSAIVINKIPTIRAATCYNEFSAKSAREHNNACVLCVGAKSLGEETIKSIVDVFLNTEFAGGRHQRRLDKITAIEQNLFNSKNGNK
ncbi:ribose 5-phosphate isomerase b [hydrocarbon metagenome]|uniref:Ribose 5-phosphate isomerase b n=1 Tax=hydrocarbon metagenome TaxID=938273 RepID=A0A0W8FZ64_9ZZZZ